MGGGWRVAGRGGGGARGALERRRGALSGVRGGLGADSTNFTEDSLANAIATQDSRIGGLLFGTFKYNIDDILTAIKIYGELNIANIESLINKAKNVSGSKLSHTDDKLLNSLIEELNKREEFGGSGGRRSPRRATRKHRTSYRRNRKASRRYR